jgi:hypothetical protein
MEVFYFFSEYILNRWPIPAITNLTEINLNQSYSVNKNKSIFSHITYVSNPE